MKNMYNPKTAQCSFNHHYDDGDVLYKQVVVYSWKMLQYLSTWRWGEQEGPLLVGESVAEVAPVAVGTGVAGKDHPAKLGLVAWGPDYRTQFSDALSELAVVTVWTRATCCTALSSSSLDCIPPNSTASYPPLPSSSPYEQKKLMIFLISAK